MSTSSSLPKVKIITPISVTLFAARCFEKVSDPTTQWTDVHRRIIFAMAKAASATLQQLILPNPEDQGWKKQGEIHGHRDTIIYYRVKHPKILLFVGWKRRLSVAYYFVHFYRSSTRVNCITHGCLDGTHQN
jgi:hypothetical protein